MQIGLHEIDYYKSPPGPVLSKLDPFVSTDGIFVSGRQAS